jgi:hypothetical protein
MLAECFAMKDSKPSGQSTSTTEIEITVLDNADSHVIEVLLSHSSDRPLSAATYAGRIYSAVRLIQDHRLCDWMGNRGAADVTRFSAANFEGALKLVQLFR